METNVLQPGAVNHQLSKMMPEAGTLQAPPVLLFLRQLIVPLETLPVPTVCAWGKGSSVLPPAGADISIAHPEHENAPGITKDSCPAPYCCHCNTWLLRCGCNSRRGDTAGTSVPMRIDPFICSEP